MSQRDKRIIKVAVLGPESSGKTSLCRYLAEKWNTSYAHEYVRGYLRKGRKISKPADLFEIALKQLRVEKTRERRANFICFCDTELINLKVWSEIAFGSCDERLLELLELNRYDLYILTHPNLPWSSDSLRKGDLSPHELFETYKKEIVASNTPFFEVEEVSIKRHTQAQAGLMKSLKAL